jgi:tetratricopeptide (TPR) repeat protein
MIPAFDTILSDKRLFYVAYVVVGLGVVGTGIYGYRWYQAGKEQAAYKELAQSIDAYERITMLADSEKELQDSERAFKAGAEGHSSSALYPFFLAFEADTLIRLGKIDEAAVLLDKAVKAMGQSNPLYHLYALKAALVKLDTQDATLQQEGRASLDSLASMAANPLQDMALYYAGLYADTKGDHSTAVTRFKEIIAHGKKDSYWYQRADEKVQAGD